MNENDTDLHLILRQSYRGRQNQRLAQSFQRREETTKRAKITPPKRWENLTPQQQRTSLETWISS